MLQKRLGSTRVNYGSIPCNLAICNLNCMRTGNHQHLSSLTKGSSFVLFCFLTLPTGGDWFHVTCLIKIRVCFWNSIHKVCKLFAKEKFDVLIAPDNKSLFLSSNKSFKTTFPDTVANLLPNMNILAGFR